MVLVHKLLKKLRGKSQKKSSRRRALMQATILLPWLVNSSTANAMDSVELCRHTIVLEAVLESVAEELAGIDTKGLVIADVGQQQATITFDDAFCYGTLVYEPIPQQPILLPVAYRVQEDIDNIYVTLLGLEL